MHPLTVPELLSVWERGLGTRPFEQALTILSAADPESSATALARLSIGRRDAMLLQLREWAFGSELPTVAECPCCHRPVEATLAAADLCPVIKAEGDGRISLTVGNYKLCCRPPNSEDLAACAGLDIGESRQMLRARCVLQASCQGESVPSALLPDPVLETAMERIAAEDQVETHIEFACPDCEYRWNELFDIVSFFWTEIHVWGRRLLREVHVLAAAYGWNEHDILSLSPLRRQIYLAMAER